MMTFFAIIATLALVGVLGSGFIISNHLLEQRQLQLSMTADPVPGDYWHLYGVGRVMVQEVQLLAGKISLVREDGPQQTTWMALSEFMNKATPEGKQLRRAGRFDRVQRMRDRR